MIYQGVLVTDRLDIRPFRQGDVAAMVRLFADPRVAKYVDDGAPLSKANAELWVKRSAANLREYGYGTGAVIERATGLLIGWAGFARPANDPEEIIFGLAADRWKQGFGGEILSGLLDHADRVVRADIVRATVDPANSASIHLLTRHRFQLAERAYRGEPDCDLYIRTAPDLFR
jgi:RimJ/RimL family protein N-acetyltransferase